MLSPYGHEKEILLEEKYKGVESPQYLADCVRLENGEPLGYVMGFVNFLGAHIDLSLKPMIPRFETAFWVKRAIEELKVKQEKLERPLRLADTFSGSGCVGIALLKNIPKCFVTLSELDPNLKPQIELSLAMNGIPQERFEVLSQSALTGLTLPYDALVANPPYIDKKFKDDLDPEQLDHEPHLAFFAPQDGKNFHQVVIEEAWDLLTEEGTVYMEADSYQHDALVELLKKTKWKYEFWADPYGAKPFLILQKNTENT